MRTATATASGRSAASTSQGACCRRLRTHVVRRYRDDGGATRELIARPAAGGSMLLVDRDLLSGDDQRLVAHLGAEEPSANVLLAARLFLEAAPGERRCRRLAEEDLRAAPDLPSTDTADVLADTAPAVLATTCGFRLQSVPGEMSIPALRWTCGPREAHGAGTPVSLREAIATVEDYEPLCELTRSALARYERDQAISTTVIRAELTRVQRSPIVLNRGLREAVLAKVARGEASMSEIAIRCGRLKHDARGNTTGETSWLARRVGLLPEGGHSEPTRWVHSDVLALIARDGLAIAPREVELG